MVNMKVVISAGLFLLVGATCDAMAQCAVNPLPLGQIRKLVGGNTVCGRPAAGYPGGASSLGLVACGTITGLFAFTAADLYGPYWFFRLHVACEAFLGVGLLHLALVFPVVRAHRHRLRILATLYVASGLFAATYETALFEPRAYTAMHLLASATHGAGAAHRLVLALQGDAVPASLDPRLVRQVLQNLLQNAIKYSPDGGTVELGVDRDADGVTFRVRDQGLGIAPADLPHVFETFYRAESVSGIEGTGLGLAIAGRAASLHGGTISVESTPGRGTTFLVRLPHDEPGEANGRAHSAALRCRHDGRLREAPRP